MTALIYFFYYVIGGFLEMVWYAVAYKYRISTVTVLGCVLVYMISRLVFA